MSEDLSTPLPTLLQAQVREARPQGQSGRSGVSGAAEQPPPEVPRFLAQDACREVLAQLHSFGLALDARVDLTSQWRGDVRWARNRIEHEGDWRTNTLRIGSVGTLTLNQVDVAALRAVTTRAREVVGLLSEPMEPIVPWMRRWPYPQTHIWGDATYAQSPEERTRLVTQATLTTEQAGMVAAGYLAVEARGTMYWLKNGLFCYAPQTLAQCSLTVRDPQGTGSGWAGASSYDWTKIDVATLTAIALDKCLKSRNPVKVEPGRYTTILEPQATYELVRQVFSGNPVDDGGTISLEANEKSDENRDRIPFTDAPTVLHYRTKTGSVSYGKTRLGQQVMDPRLTVRSDPLDPELGTLPFSFQWGDPFVPVTWVEHGVLKTLATGSEYAVTQLREQPQPWSGAFRVEGSDAPVSVEEMIATTKRGLLVTRLWDVHVVDQNSVLCSGLTRDGLWLIENGKISHPVLNFRFTESSMFALNNVEQIGQPVPIFHPECPAVVPALKVRDFSFTSLIDAV